MISSGTRSSPIILIEVTDLLRCAIGSGCRSINNWTYPSMLVVDGNRQLKSFAGVARQQVTFLVLPRKVTKRGQTPVCRPFGVPSVARLVRLPHKLARSATRPRAQTYSSEFPDQPPLLGGTQGKENNKSKPKPGGGHDVPTSFYCTDGKKPGATRPGHCANTCKGACQPNW